jgi:S1-C subfamily serine protease
MQQGMWTPEASGFLYGEFVSKVSETESKYRTYLVTNRHVIEEHAAATKAPLSVKFNLKTAGASREYDVMLTDERGQPTWHPHPNAAVDIAVIPIDANFLQKEGARFDYFRGESDVLSRSRAKEMGLSEGDGVYVLGFPMGLVGAQQDYVVVRQGTIARVTDALESPVATSFLIDSFNFPGSSGSPVVLRPELLSITGAKPAIGKAYLLGVVRSYLPYTDVAVSMQTKRPRVTFEENSGLAEVIPIDFVEEAVKAYERAHPPGLARC